MFGWLWEFLQFYEFWFGAFYKLESFVPLSAYRIVLADESIMNYAAYIDILLGLLGDTRKYIV